ncbi:MAG: hypothetical protein GXO87_10950 [Chlorobi bacterium]|nr:hypothetical protein [Chlorobiota bacterium]
MKIVDYFLPDNTEGELYNRYKFVVIIILVTFLMDAAFLAPLFIFGMPLGAAALVIAVLIGFTALFIFRSSGNLTFLSEIMNFTIYFRIVALTVLSGGFNSSALFFFTFLPLFSLLISSKKSGVFWTAVASGSIVAFGLIGDLPIRYNPEWGNFIAIFFSFASPILIAVIAFVFLSQNENVKAELISTKNRIEEKIEEATSALRTEQKKSMRLAEENLRIQKEENLMLSKNIDYILEAMEQCSAGDLTVRLEGETDCKFTKLFEGFNSTMESLSDFIKKVAEDAQRTSLVSEKISGATDAMASGAEEQMTRASGATIAIEQMTETIKQTVERSKSVSDSSKQSSELANEGERELNKTKEGMHKIAESTEQMAEIIKTLANHSEHIGDIAKVINDIADQTNLLALNAAIEAARAGEEGRGFAVVADEVRKLAERTSKATKEIGKKISDIQSEARKADYSMAETKQAVEDGTKLTKEVNVFLKKILESNAGVYEKTLEVVTENEGQSEIADSVAAEIEAVRSISENISNVINDIIYAGEDLSEQTDKLLEHIKRFKV